MDNVIKEWRIASKLKSQNLRLDIEKITNILLKNRGIKTKTEKKEFFDPTDPNEISLKELDIKESEVSKSITRIKKAIEKKEKIFIYGDYDADGICATAILWENLFALNKNTLPYIPDRFSEGYGI